MGETLTRADLDYIAEHLARVQHSGGVSLDREDLTALLRTARASLDLAEQLREALESAGANAEALLPARRELWEVREQLAAAEALLEWQESPVCSGEEFQDELRNYREKYEKGTDHE